MARKYSFKVKKNKNKKDAFDRVPDYDSIIELNKKPYSIIGYTENLTGNLSMTIEEVTDERLKSNGFLRTKYVEYLGKKKQQNLFNKND
jgi:hypothetical protein|tara:strand:- start:757 stop:1023 length:267 start_codon:yes stop_codon:yes gene_type:complete